MFLQLFGLYFSLAAVAILYQASLQLPWLYIVKLMISIKCEYKAFNPFAGTGEKGKGYV